jgi:hypothetical protein
MLLGGLLGFGLGLVFSLARENSWPTTLWHACLAAYLTSLLLRWWGKTWRKSLENAMLDSQSGPVPSLPISALSKAAK